MVSLAQELKDNNMSVDDFVNYIKQQSINEYTSAQ
nr:MAG TPA: HTH-type transcriptional regulator [Caudoviricetes sp.]